MSSLFQIKTHADANKLTSHINSAALDIKLKDIFLKCEKIESPLIGYSIVRTQFVTQFLN